MESRRWRVFGDELQIRMKIILSWRRALLALGVLPVAVSLPAAEGKRRFDLPAGDAAVTLARFAEQADREIVFSPAAVREIGRAHV